MSKLKEFLRLDPIYILVMPVIAALPFLLVRVFSPGPRAGAGRTAPAPSLSMALSDEGEGKKISIIGAARSGVGAAKLCKTAGWNSFC